MADSESVDTTQQVTSKTPTTKQKKPKRVAAGKAIAAKTKQAREAQKKALAEAQIIIANDKLKHDAPPVADPPPVETKNVLTTTQWLSVVSILVSLASIYYKREEIKSLLTKKAPQNVDTTPPAPLPYLLMLRQKEKDVSVRWIKKLIDVSFLIKNGTEI